MTTPSQSTHKKLFLSAVSSEFEPCRQLLRQDLKRPTLDVAVQEDFVVSGGLTLEKLDTYIQVCHGVIHLIGKAAGAIPGAGAAQALLTRYPEFAGKLPALAECLARPDPGFSYTQWEAYLAIYHERPVFIYRAADFEPAEPAQQEHYRRIGALGRDRGQFLNPERLSAAVLRDLVEILPRLETRTDVAATKLRHTAEVLIGRDAELTALDNAWNDACRNVVVVRGKGGEGKTALVASWMAELAMKGWRGAERVLDESFYSQGTRDQSGASADAFIQAALERFGDPQPTQGSAEDRGERLARLVGAQRCLLVLDGLEPLQYPPGPLHGQLKDPGMAALLCGLAAQNAGLCVVTTREKVDEIQQHYGKAAIDLPLEFLSPAAGAALLHRAGARRAGAKQIAVDDEELQQASRGVHGHALTLSLVGGYLKLAENGDIRRRDRMKLAEADAEYKNDATRPYGHAFKAMEAYGTWFAAGDTEARRQLAILRLLGLFDRPASKGCLTALRAEPAIVGLTETLAGGSDKEWRIALGRLQEIQLVDVQEDGSVDGHPLLREYFAMRLRKQHPEAWREAHSRLFDHLCETTEHWPDTLAGLQPLYQAVSHGCLAERHEEACAYVYRDRILRGADPGGYYSTKQLGAIGADLGAVAAFFEEPWSRLSSHLSAPDQAWLIAVAAFSLSALGRLTEAIEPTRVGLDRRVEMSDSGNAAASAINLSGMEVTLGRLGKAVADGRRAIDFAERSGNAFMKLASRTTSADALHQAGERSDAGTLLAEAERLQAEGQPEYPLLYSVRGFLYAELILASAERAAWAKIARRGDKGWPLLDACGEAERRATQALVIAERHHWLLDIALDHLTLARVRLYRSLLEGNAGDPTTAQTTYTAVQAALGKLREASRLDHLPKALLTAALHAAAVAGDPSAAHRHLDEAQRIAERGPMPLYLADVHLHRARLFRDRAALAEARKLIEAHGYWRRREELEDAEAAAAQWPSSDTSQPR